MAEVTENVQGQQELTEEQKAEMIKQSTAYFKKQTQLLKVRADYEEQRMRIATYQRDTLFAEIDMMRFEQQQQQAQEAASKKEEENKEENEESPKVRKLLKTDSEK